MPIVVQFNVTEEETDLKWSIRVDKGELTFAVYRRTLTETTVFKSRVSEYAISAANSPKPSSSSSSSGGGNNLRMSGITQREREREIRTLHSSFKHRFYFLKKLSELKNGKKMYA